MRVYSIKSLCLVSRSTVEAALPHRGCNALHQHYPNTHRTVGFQISLETLMATLPSLTVTFSLEPHF